MELVESHQRVTTHRVVPSGRWVLQATRGSCDDGDGERGGGDGGEASVEKSAEKEGCKVVNESEKEGKARRIAVVSNRDNASARKFSWDGIQAARREM